MKSLGFFLKTWYPSILIAVVIFIFSSFPAAESDTQSGLIVNVLTSLFPDLQNVESLVTIVRKIAHFTEYALLGFFTARAFNLNKKSGWWSILACAIYASSDELHQTFIPGRSGEFKDVLLDTAGATVGAAIYALIHKSK